MGAGFVGYGDVRAHGLVVLMAGPIHDYGDRNAEADGCDDKSMAGCVGGDEFVFWQRVVVPHVADVI